MIDLSGPIRDLEQLRGFLTRWDDTARPPTDPFGLAEQWLAKASLAHDWTELKNALAGAHSHAKLLATSERLVKLLREQKSGFGFKLFASQPSPTEIVTTLENLCLALTSESTTLIGRLSEAMTTELRSTPITLLVQLLGDVSLAELPSAVWRESEWTTPSASVGAKDFLDELQDEAKLAPERAAAVLVAWRLTDIWARHVREDSAWNILESWLRRWIKQSGLCGELRLRPSDAPTAGRCQVHFQCLEPFPNSILSLDAPASLACSFESVPMETPSTTSAWSGLPKPPTCGNQTPVPLVAWFDACEQASLKRRQPPSKTDAKAQFGSWIGGVEGGAWFDALLRTDAISPDGPEAAWWRVLSESGWCVAYPPSECGELRLAWPESVTRIDNSPAGTRLEVLRYSPEPAAARVVISDGPTATDSALARFHELFRSDPTNDKLWGAGRWAKARAISLAEIPDEFAIELAESWQSVPVAFSLIARWLNCFGIEVIDPATALPDEVEQSSLFHPSTVGEYIGSGVCGYKRGDSVLKRAKRSISAGEVPEGYDALQSAAQQWPVEHPYRAGVAKLTDAIVGGYLLESALELFSTYWDQVHANRGEPARLYGEEIARFLKTSLKLETFTPQNLHEHRDGWVISTSGSRLVTGVVRRVFRPGLVDELGELRIPALAEID